MLSFLVGRTKIRPPSPLIRNDSYGLVLNVILSHTHILLIYLHRMVIVMEGLEWTVG